MTAAQAVADPENFGGGGFEAQNLKNSDVFTKIESDFSKFKRFFRPNSGGLQKKKKKKRSSPKLRLIFRPNSEIQTFFSPKLRLIFRRISYVKVGRGGCIPK